MDEHSGIHVVDGALGRRPAIIGTGLDEWDVVEVARDNAGSDRVAVGTVRSWRWANEHDARARRRRSDGVDDLAG